MKTIKVMRDGRPATKEELECAVEGKPLPPRTGCAVSQSRKILHDLMDKRRPWAHSNNVYDWMEEIVDMAEQAFTGKRRPTYKEHAEQERTILKLTESLNEHPEWHEGPCACEECRST